MGLPWFKKRVDHGIPAEGRLKILVLSASLEDRFFLERLGKQHDWELWSTGSPGEGFMWASQRHFEVILCDRNQPGYPWREVMERLVACSPRSCILLVSPMRGDYLWQDVLRKGGYDIMLRPLCEKAVLHSIDSAVRFISSAAGGMSQR